jgi:hypothetical protein
LRSAFEKELSVQALVIDLDDVRLVDVSAAIGLKDLAVAVRSSYGLRFVYINATPHVSSFLGSVGLHSDRLNVTKFYLEKIAAQVDWRHRSKYFHRKQLQDNMLFIPGRITDDATSGVGSWIRNEEFGRSLNRGLGIDASPSHTATPNFGAKRILSMSRLNESDMETGALSNGEAEACVRPITPRLYSASSMPLQPSGATDEEVDDEGRECAGLELPMGRQRLRSV